MTTTEHDHVFRRVTLRHDDGTLIEGGRRCACGLEVVGDGPFALSANLVRASRNFNQAYARAAVRLADALAAHNRRRFP